MRKRFEHSIQYPKPLGKDELGDLIDVALSGNYSRYSSSFVDELEKDLSLFYNTNFSTTATSGTGACHGTLVALDFPPGSEIITTPVTDIGTIIPVIYENLIPVFADIDPETFNIDPKSVKENITKKTKAIIAVHLAGNPADLDALKEICIKNNIILIEDFSQAHGAEWDGKKIGSHGDIAYGSFQQCKQITCGEGGVILTNSPALARRAHIGVDKSWQRDLPLEKRQYEFLAPNVRFNAIQAAVLKPQIAKLSNVIKKRREIADIYYKKFSKVSDHIKFQRVLPKATHSYFNFPMYVENPETRDSLLTLLNDKYDIKCAYGYAASVPLYMCVNALKNPKKFGKGHAYSNRSYPVGLCPNAESIMKRSFLIPFNELITKSEAHEISNRILEAVYNHF
jgi:dTDP-4-amino-4,6-dideoxygalactose transaminase